MRKLLSLFGAIRTHPDPHADARHKATLERADRLIRVAHDYDRADEARRHQ